ncbi:hypothetical protein N9N28_17620 [Rubripirellula amarantea]|nr:hypothetical protein [Rubripirellula amarantea]
MLTQQRGYETYNENGTIELFTQSIGDAYRAGMTALSRGEDSFTIGRCTHVAFINEQGEVDETCELVAGAILFRKQ